MFPETSGAGLMLGLGIAKLWHNPMADKNTADLLMEESLEQHPLLGSKNQMEAVMAGMEKRKARYEDV